MAIITLAELVEDASRSGVSMGAIVRAREAEQSGRAEDDLNSDMQERLGVMRSAVSCGLRGVRSRSGLTGGDGPRMAAARLKTSTICGWRLYTSDAAGERASVDFWGCRALQKNKKNTF